MGRLRGMQRPGPCCSLSAAQCASNRVKGEASSFGDRPGTAPPPRSGLRMKTPAENAALRDMANVYHTVPDPITQSIREETRLQSARTMTVLDPATGRPMTASIVPDLVSTARQQEAARAKGRGDEEVGAVEGLQAEDDPLPSARPSSTFGYRRPGSRAASAGVTRLPSRS